MDLESAIKQHYDAFASEYDGVDQSIERVVTRLKIVPRSKILDIGCGTGNLTLRLPELNSFRKIIGTDLSDGVLTIARKHANDLGLKNCEFLRADACRLPFDDEEFDHVVSNMVFHLISNRCKALAEIVRVLKPTGTAVLQFMGGGDVAPEMMEILHDAWNKILPEESPSNLLYKVLVEKRITIAMLEKHMAQLGIDSFEITLRRNVMKIAEADVPKFLNFFKLVGDFWQWGLNNEAAESIKRLMAEKVRSVAESMGYFSYTVNSLLVEFAKP